MKEQGPNVHYVKFDSKTTFPKYLRKIFLNNKQSETGDKEEEKERKGEKEGESGRENVSNNVAKRVLQAGPVARQQTTLSR